MQSYTITDTKTGERVEVIAPNRDAALKAHVARRLTVERTPKGVESGEPPQIPVGPIHR